MSDIPLRSKLIMHNDEATPIDVVKLILIDVIGHKNYIASALTHRVHFNGKAVIANTDQKKVNELFVIARAVLESYGSSMKLEVI